MSTMELEPKLKSSDEPTLPAEVWALWDTRRRQWRGAQSQDSIGKVWFATEEDARQAASVYTIRDSIDE